MRCLESQGAAHRREPYPDRGRGTGSPAACPQLAGHRPDLHSRARALLHLVELSLAGLDEERPRAQARSYVGLTRARRAHQGACRARAVPQVGAALGPRPADLRDRGLSAAVRSAIAMLRSGRPVRIEGRATIAVCAVETATQELLDILDPKHGARLLISGQRAAALNLSNERDAADPAAPVLIGHAPWLDAATARAIADPGQDLDRAPVGPLRPLSSDCAETSRAALDLARAAGLLPALWVLDPAAADFSVSVDEVPRERQQPSV